MPEPLTRTSIKRRIDNGDWYDGGSGPLDDLRAEVLWSVEDGDTRFDIDAIDLAKLLAEVCERRAADSV